MEYQRLRVFLPGTESLVRRKQPMIISQFKDKLQTYQDLIKEAVFKFQPNCRNISVMNGKDDTTDRSEHGAAHVVASYYTKAGENSGRSLKWFYCTFSKTIFKETGEEFATFNKDLLDNMNADIIYLWMDPETSRFTYFNKQEIKEKGYLINSKKSNCDMYAVNLKLADIEYFDGTDYFEKDLQFMYLQNCRYTTKGNYLGNYKVIRVAADGKQTEFVGINMKDVYTKYLKEFGECDDISYNTFKYRFRKGTDLKVGEVTLKFYSNNVNNYTKPNRKQLKTMTLGEVEEELSKIYDKSEEIILEEIVSAKAVELFEQFARQKPDATIYELYSAILNNIYRNPSVFDNSVEE